ncbi:MAG: RidA family protein [Azonexus sp.]|jgi:enamine deaminase RidA (YjgF/YER057c/UK114 family)|nr:RidA family protein [Azonexus sp.]
MAIFRQSAQLTLANPDGLYDPAGYGYSHVAQVAAASRLVYIAGQGGETEDGHYAEGFQAQVRQAFKNLLTALRSAGAGPKDVAKLTVYIVDHSEARLGIYGAELMVAWGETPKPACTLVPVPRLALDVMLFEIEAVAALPG